MPEELHIGANLGEAPAENLQPAVELQLSELQQMRKEVETPKELQSPEDKCHRRFGLTGCRCCDLMGRH